MSSLTLGRAALPSFRRLLATRAHARAPRHVATLEFLFEHPEYVPDVP